ncbi:MAG: hypothetical protein HYZ73_04215 [Elusimicrobia bacterium]|nr:hypothetical protein [Elusimicrobiota bacterium]
MTVWIMWVEILLGVSCVLVGLGLLYHPEMIFKLTAFLRNKLLNDAVILLQRQKMGILLVLLGFLSLFLGLLSETHWHDHSPVSFSPPPALSPVEGPTPSHPSPTPRNPPPPPGKE